MTEVKELMLANELEAIRSGVDAFNPDAREAARSAFEAAERVWKMVPDIIETLRSRTLSDSGDDVVERVFAEDINKQAVRVGVHARDTDSPGQWMMRVRKAALKAALSTPEIVEDRLSRMREALEEARGVIRADRDSLFECCTVGPKHDPSTLEDGAAAAVGDYDRTLAKIDSILEELKEG